MKLNTALSIISQAQADLSISQSVLSRLQKAIEEEDTLAALEELSELKERLDTTEATLYITEND
jgi:hypothetical protein